MTTPIRPPRPVAFAHWLMGWLCIFFGLVFFLVGSVLIPTHTHTILGAIFVMIAGIGVGAGGRILVACYQARRIYRRQVARKP